MEREYEVKVNKWTLSGWFEHNKLGEDGGAGELEFEVRNNRITLIGYDGVFALPQDVLVQLEEMDIDCDEVIDSLI